jgi:alpha-tubulin suppressor-like RCC1 family protein
MTQPRSCSTESSSLVPRQLSRALCAFAALLAGALAAPSQAATPPQVSANSDTTCAIVAGAAYCWGYNADGQVGNNSVLPALAPTLVAGLASGVTAISVGLGHVCAVANGAAYCWGDNSTGQLGDNTVIDKHTPVAVSGLASGVTAISAGDNHSCAIVNASIRCWGSNLGYGQLGDGTSSDSRVPVGVFGSNGGASAISAGHRHTCAVANGAGFCWGDNTNGELGVGSSGNISRFPLMVSGFGSGVTAVEAGGAYSCGVVNGAAYCWGFNGNGQLGNGGGNPVSLPSPVTGLGADVTDIAASRSYHACAVVNHGAQCWGYNNAGQLGNPAAGGGSASPVPVSGLSGGVRSIAAGGLHTCAVGGAGIYCWGDNSSGQLGTGNTTPSNVPLLVVVAPSDGARTDFTGDGRSDILYRNATTGQVYRLLMNGFSVSNGAIAYTEPNTAWKIVADADFNGDGIADLLWRNDATGAVYYMPFAANGLPGGGAVVVTEPNLAWKIVQATDLDGDGNADLVWWNSTTGQVYAMLMNGASIVDQGLIYTEPNTAWKIVAAGDFYGSGVRNQLLWRNGTTGQVFMLVVDLVNGLSGGLIYTEPNTAWKILGAADFNGDGKSDILWRNDATGQVFVQLMNGAAVAGGGIVHSEPNLAWKIVAQGDYNGDGKADLLWRNDTTGQVYMMLMNGLAIANQAFVYTEPNTAWKVMGPGEYAQ